MHACRKLGVHHLTVYAFSAENWRRPETEIHDIFGLMKFYLRRELAAFKENGIRLRVIGDLSRLPADLRAMIEEAEQETLAGGVFDLTVCFSYGARQEMSAAARAMAEDVRIGRLLPESINVDTLSRYLYTAHLPEPDLLIRTGGEKRLSNFLLWQCAYTELYFTEILWPDFGEAHFVEACRDFSHRERRYGLTD
jgi:undecaprenyl diphosphate synthase